MLDYTIEENFMQGLCCKENECIRFAILDAKIEQSERHIEILKEQLFSCNTEVIKLTEMVRMKCN